MSHHLDCPIARQDVRLDITDLYLFRGEIGTVFIINVCHSIAGNIPVPGYHPEGMYEFKTVTPSKISLIASLSVNVMQREGRASRCGVFLVLRLPIPMRRAQSLQKEL